MNVRRGIAITPATWLVWIRSPGMRRPANTPSQPDRRRRRLARSIGPWTWSRAATFIRAGAPARFRIARATSAPAIEARLAATTNSAGLTPWVAIAIPPSIKTRSPGANGNGTPHSSMNSSPLMARITTTGSSPPRMPFMTSRAYGGAAGSGRVLPPEFAVTNTTLCA